MPSNKAIRIIKREQREILANQQDVPECESKTENQTRRDIIKTITLWIEEQRTTRQELCRFQEIFTQVSADETAGV